MLLLRLRRALMLSLRPVRPPCGWASEPLRFWLPALVRLSHRVEPSADASLSSPADDSPHRRGSFVLVSVCLLQLSMRTVSYFVCHIILCIVSKGMLRNYCRFGG